MSAHTGDAQPDAERERRIRRHVVLILTLIVLAEAGFL